MKLRISVYECGFFVESKIFTSDEIVEICNFRNKFKDFPDIKLVSEVL